MHQGLGLPITVGKDRKSITVGAGITLDGEGHDLRVEAPRTLAPSPENGPHQDVCILPAPPGPRGSAGPPDIQAVAPDHLPPGAVVLAELDLTRDGTISAVRTELPREDESASLQSRSWNSYVNLTVKSSLAVGQGLAVGVAPDTTGPQKLSINDGGIGFTGAGLNADQKKLWSPTDGLLRWQTDDGAAAHALEVGHQETPAAVHLDTHGSSWLTGGKLGIGTPEPQGQLDVRVPGTGCWDRFVVTTTSQWGDADASYVTIGAGGASGIMLSNPYVTWFADRASIRYGRSDGVPGGGYWDVGVRGSDAFSFSLNGVADHKLWLSSNGNVGIATETPWARLSVAGPAGGQPDGSAMSRTLLALSGPLDRAEKSESVLASIGYRDELNTTALGIHARRIAEGSGWQTTALGLSMDVDNTLHVNDASLWLNASGNVGIGTPSPTERLEVAGNVKIGGSFLISAQGFRILETNATDWLRINPGGQYPAIALYRPVAVGMGGLSVGDWSQQPQGQLWVTGNALIGGSIGIGTQGNPTEQLEVAGNVKIGKSGQTGTSRLLNAEGYGILQTDATDWLRINPDCQYPAIALHMPVAIGLGGLAVGEWSPQPQGQLWVTGNALVGGSVGIGIGNAAPAAKLEVRGAADPSSAALKVTDRSGGSLLEVKNDGSMSLRGPLLAGKLDVQTTPRTGEHPTDVQGLYLTGDFEADKGVELRRTDGTQGIGIGYNTLYATGSDKDQPLFLKPRGVAPVAIQGGLMPAAGDSPCAGIQFPSDPGGGGPGGDFAFIRYHNVGGGTCKLRIGIGNDLDDTISLYQFKEDRLTVYNGNVGIGTSEPTERLEVAGNVKIGGSRLLNAQGCGILQTDATDWLRINPDSHYSKIALYRPVAIGMGGLSVGEWSEQPPGQLWVAGKALIGSIIGIGTDAPHAHLSVVGPDGVQLDGSAMSPTFLATSGTLGPAAGSELTLASIGFHSPNNTALGIHAYRPVAGQDWTTTAIGLCMDVDDTSHASPASLWLNASGYVGIGTSNPTAHLEVTGNVKVGGSRLLNAQGYGILQTDATDWLRVNPDGQYPAIALFNPVAIGTGGLAVGDWIQPPQGQLWVTGNALIGGSIGIGTQGNPTERLEVAGNVKIDGRYLVSAQGFGILQTDATDWLRINPGGQYPAIALYRSVAVGIGGLSVGDWSQQPQGQLRVTGNAFIGSSVGIGTDTPHAHLSVIGPDGVQLDGSAMSPTFLATSGTLGPAAGSELALASIGFRSPTNRGTALGIRAYRPVTGLDWTTTAIGLCIDVDDTSHASPASLWLNASGYVGIGTSNPTAHLEVAGNVRVGGSRLLSAQGFGILQTDATDWLRINPDSQYHAIALFNPVAIGTGSLSIGDWSTPPAGQLRVMGNAFFASSVGIGIQGSPTERLEVAGNVKVGGVRLLSGKGPSIVDTYRTDWLCINPDGQYPGIALLKPVAIATGGLSIGDWSQPPQGQLRTTANAIIGGSVSIGTQGSPTERLEVAGNVKLTGNVIFDGNLHATASGEPRLRIVRGLVGADPAQYADINARQGGSFWVEYVGLGAYDVYFDPAFDAPPTVVVTQVFDGNADLFGGDTRDNAVIVGIECNRVRIKTGNCYGDATPRGFSFIAMG